MARRKLIKPKRRSRLSSTVLLVVCAIVGAMEIFDYRSDPHVFAFAEESNAKQNVITSLPRSQESHLLGIEGRIPLKGKDSLILGNYRSRELQKRKRAGNSPGSNKKRAGGRTSSGNKKKKRGANRNGANRDGTGKGMKKGRAIDGSTQSSTGRKRKGGNGNRQKNVAGSINMKTRTDPQVIETDSETATDHFLTKFYGKFEEEKTKKEKKRKDRNKQSGSEHSDNASAGYDNPGVYAGESSWASSGGMDEHYGGGKSGKASGGSEGGSESHPIKVDPELVNEYTDVCPCVYVDAPGGGSGGSPSWGGISSWSGSISETSYGTKSGKTESTSYAASDTKSSKRKRKLQWGEAHYKPERIKVCTCPPTYFPTFLPTQMPTTEEPT